MGRLDIHKRLPKRFRFLFSIKEIKKIEIQLGFKFHQIINGNLTNSKKFDDDSFFQSSIHGFSIHGRFSEEEWLFTFHQSGFRNDLLPEKYEKQVKNEIEIKIINYLNTILNSKETDFFKHPQLWGNIWIIKDQTSTNYREIK